MVSKTLKLIGSALDWILSGAVAFIFISWLFGFTKVYSLFGKIFIVIG